MSARLLLLDNFDSFTYNLADYLQQTGAEVEVERNNQPLHYFDLNKYQSLVLSPGPGTPAEAGVLLPLLKEALVINLPVLGVCLGFQAIATHFGALLTKAAEPMHGRLSTCSWLLPDPIRQNIPNQHIITRYHSLEVQNLTAELQVLAISETATTMALRHRHKAVWGVQFHPEALLTEYGDTLIRNFVAETLKQ